MVKRDVEDTNARASRAHYTRPLDRYRTPLIGCSLASEMVHSGKLVATNVCLATAPPRVRIIEQSLKSFKSESASGTTATTDVDTDTDTYRGAYRDRSAG